MDDSERCEYLTGNLWKHELNEVLGLLGRRFEIQDNLDSSFPSYMMLYKRLHGLGQCVVYEVNEDGLCWHFVDY